MSESGYDYEIQGCGSCTFSDGSHYEGEFVDGLFEGQGKHTYANGAVYEGGFKEGLYSGQGTFSWPGDLPVTGEFGFGNFVGAFDRHAGPRRRKLRIQTEWSLRCAVFLLGMAAGYTLWH